MMSTAAPGARKEATTGSKTRVWFDLRTDPCYQARLTQPETHERTM